MATATLTVTHNLTGASVGSESFSATSVANTAVPQTVPVALSSGNNTITVPSGVSWVTIFPPNFTAPGVAAPNPNSTVTLSLGATDQIPISSFGPTELNWTVAPQGTAPSPPSTFVIHASGSCTVNLVYA